MVSIYQVVNYQFKSDSLSSARPCDKHGTFLDEDEPPPHPQPHSPTDWTPFTSRLQFEMAEFLFQHVQMSAGNIDMLLQLWAAGVATYDDGEPPFINHGDIYDRIDAIPLGNVPWQKFDISYNGVRPESEVPPWMEHAYEVYFRDLHQLLLDMLANPTFANDFDYIPTQQFTSDGTHQYEHFMSGDWAWKQAIRHLFFHDNTFNNFVVCTRHHYGRDSWRKRCHVCGCNHG